MMNKNESFRYKHFLRVVNRLKTNKLSPAFIFENYSGVKNRYFVKCDICKFEFESSFDNGHIPKCPKCFPNRLTINYGHSETVCLKCEFCDKLFTVIWKNRHHRFCSVMCKNEFIKRDKREIVNCLNCKTPFERYKYIINSQTGKPTQYCSNKCNRSSIEVSKKKQAWGLSDKNHWRNPICQLKVKQTKLKLYGDANYNNMNKNRKTMMDRYGVPCAFYLPKCKSNGKRISKFQKRIYAEMLKTHPDAILEEYLKDVQKSVDIFIPTENRIIECQGDYWHCNPSSFKPDYYNNMVHLTAQQIWNRDAEKKRLLESAGYKVEVIWENTNKHFKHSTQ